MEQNKAINKYQCDICALSFKKKIEFNRHKSKKECIEDTLEDKEELTNLFRWSLDFLRDREHLTGEKALRCITSLLILRLSEPQIINGNINIYNMDYYDLNNYDEKNIKYYMNLTIFKNLKNIPENDYISTLMRLREVILIYHPKFKDLFNLDDPFRIKYGSSFKELIKKYSNFPFEKYEVDIQGEAYEEVIKDIMTGKILGQFFTPSIVKQLMVDLINPKVYPDGTTETVFDPAMGTGGFLITTYRHFYKIAKEQNIKLDDNFIKINGLSGREVEPDTYQIAKANMLISSGQIFDSLKHKDSIRDKITDKYDIVLANPPFGIKGLNYDGIQIVGKCDYLPIKSNSAIPLFLQLMIYILKINGRCATIVPDGQDLFNKGYTYVSLREYIMKTSDLKKVIILPPNIFTNTNIKTCVLYFEKLKEGSDVMKIKKNKTKTDYIFVKEHQTKSVKFYEYDIFTKEKKLLIDVSIEQIAKNNYSLNYNDYIEKKDEVCVDNFNTKSLGDICEFISGKKRNANEALETGKYKFITCSIQGYSYLDDYDYEDKALIINSINGSGRCMIYCTDKYSTTSNNFHFKIKDKELVITEYIYYYLYYHIELLETGFLGSNQKKISKEYIEKINIPIPSLNKQKNIIKQLDLLENNKNTCKKNIDELEKIIKNYIYHHLLSKKTNLLLLADICEFKNGQNITKDKLIDGPYPVVGGGKSPFGYNNKYNVDENTILISKDGAYAGYVSKYPNKVFVSNHGIYISKINNGYEKDYIYYSLKLILQDDIYKLQTGAAQPGINKEQLMKLKISVPSLDEQKEIITRCNHTYDLIKNLEEQIKYNDQLSKQIINNIVTKVD